MEGLRLVSVATCKGSGLDSSHANHVLVYSIYNVLNKVPAKLRRAMVLVGCPRKLEFIWGCCISRSRWAANLAETSGRCQWSRLLWTWWWRLSGLLRARKVSRAMSGHLCEYNLTNKMNVAEMQSDSTHFLEYIINRIYENVISTWWIRSLSEFKLSSTSPSGNRGRNDKHLQLITS